MKNKNYRGLVINNDQIYGFEPYFDKNVIIASIDHEKKEIRPTHGYFIPNPFGIKAENYAKKIGYNFNNK
jgi:hypothetical protein